MEKGMPAKDVQVFEIVVGIEETRPVRKGILSACKQAKLIVIDETQLFQQPAFVFPAVMKVDAEDEKTGLNKDHQKQEGRVALDEIIATPFQTQKDGQP